MMSEPIDDYTGRRMTLDSGKTDMPTYQDLLSILIDLVDLLENGSDGWSTRDYRIHEENVLYDANEILEKVAERGE